MCEWECSHRLCSQIKETYKAVRRGETKNIPQVLEKKRVLPFLGETKPAYPNMNPDGSDSPDNRQLNRRVEIKIEIPEMADLYISL